MSRLGPWLKRMLTISLLIVGALLWIWHLQAADWRGMWRAVAQIPLESLESAGALAFASYLVYSSIDLLARRVVGHRIGTARVLAIGFVSHACALNLGPAGAGFRFRLYLRHGLSTAQCAAVWLFNIAANWLGFVLLAGAALAGGMASLPASWALPGSASVLLGVAMLAMLAGYVAACAVAHGRAWRVLGRELTLPGPLVALAQCIASAVNWCLLAAVVTMLLQHRVEASAVLAALMSCALALAVVDVPAGLGVIETVFLAMFGSQVPAPELLAALLAYRAIYYLFPLLLALAMYMLLEFDAGRGLAALRRSPTERSRGLPPASLALPPHPPTSGSRQSPP